MTVSWSFVIIVSVNINCESGKIDEFGEEWSSIRNIRFWLVLKGRETLCGIQNMAWWLIYR